MESHHDMLTTFLSDHDTECPGCGYNLRALTGTRCPECNQELVLRVGLAEPRLGAYLGAVCGLLAGIGLAMLILSLAGYFSLTQGSPPRREAWPIFGIPSVALIVLGAMLTYLLGQSGRARFRRASMKTQVLLIAGCWGTSLGFVVWTIWTISP